MDFLAQQEAARKKSAWLTVAAVAFLLPVMAITGWILSWAIRFAWLALNDHLAPAAESATVAYPIAALIVILSALVAYSRISSGKALMRRVDARAARRHDEQVLLNVVEEMSIASGVDMPSVWVQDDDKGVNAFAAGFGEGDAAVCVTEGALRYLTRDELQGVVAHEFGHILNGDMRLNSRLVALVEGLSGISTLGKTMLRPFGGLFRIEDDEKDRASHWGGWRGGSSKGGGSAVGLLILVYVFTGAALWLIGLGGVFFARILQGAVSREREFLADAAAVQFTRNPEGLADALRFTRLLKHVGWTNRNGSVANVCHMFFIGEDWGRTDMHPPIADRVARLSRAGLLVHDARFRERLARVKKDREAQVRRNYAEYCKAKSVDELFNPRSVKIPPALMARLRTPAGAGTVLCGLAQGVRPAEWTGEMSAKAKRDVAFKAVVTLRQQGTEADVAAWADRIETAAKDGGEVGSFAFMLLCAVRRRLRASAPPPVRKPAYLTQPAAEVVSTVAAYGANGDAAYELARRRLAVFFPGWPERPAPLESVSRLFADLDALRSLSLVIKQEYLATLKAVVAEDRVVTDDEANYLAAVADAIGVFGWNML